MAISDLLAVIGALECLLCPSTLLYEGPGRWHLLCPISFLHDILARAITAFQDDVIGMGNGNSELWILVLIDATDIPVDNDGSFSYCNEVVQEKEEGRCTA